MENSQMADILRSFTKTEFREFGKFLHSPYFNNRSEVIRFYESLKKYYPEFKSNLFTQKKLFTKVYPDKKYSDVMMRKLVSLLTGQAMDFMAIESFKENQHDYNVKLIYTLYEKNLPAIFEKKAKNIEKFFRNSKHTLDYYEAKFKYTSWLTAHLINKNESGTIARYQNELDDFIEYFLIVILMQYHRVKSYTNMYNIKYDLKFFNEVIEFLNKHDYKHSTLVSLYHNLVMLSYTEEDKYFFDLLKFWEKFEKKLTDLLQFIIYVGLYNYCINRKQKGEIKYEKLQFDITKSYFGKNILPKDTGYFQANLFAAVIHNASILKEFNWVLEFINKYKKRLDPETAEETINYSFAVIEFEKGDFEKSLTYLSTINPERMNRKLNVKNLLIRIYYELNYTEELISTIDTYKHYMHRNTDITEQARINNVLFIKFISSLVKVKFNENKDSAWLLREEIEAASFFILKDWLLVKTDELLKSRII